MAKLVYTGLHLVIASNVVCLMPTLIIAVIVYAVAALLVGAVGREQLLNLPKGRLLVRVAESCHLLRREQ